jgi:serine/threonine-protein kinase
MLGQYELRDLLGVGGMGAVYRGYQVSLKREVAIKVLSPQLAQQAGYIERFNREAETAAALEHRHIVPIHDYGTQRGISYVVMRLLTGGTLADRLALSTEQDRPLPSLGEVAEVLKQLASALDYAHSQGVIHRDIKPSNVMFDNQGAAYLVDFGIAKLIEATHALTGTGVTMGTPAYMSPEQWKADTLTPATDQYALGVMIYALITGHVPFEAPTPYALMNKHLNEVPTPLQFVRPDVPQAVNEVLIRAMAKNASDRFPTCTAFAQTFDKAIRGQTGEVTNFFTAPVRRKPVASSTPPAASGIFASGGTAAGRPLHRHPLVWLMALGLVGMAAVIAFLVLGNGSKSKATPTAAAVGALTDVSTIVPSETPPSGPTLTPTSAPTKLVIEMVVPSTTTAEPSQTPDQDATMEAEFYARLTATAQSWTATPTVAATSTATLTAVPTITATRTFTAVPTSTQTLTPTSSPTATLVPAVGESGGVVLVVASFPVTMRSGLSFSSIALDSVKNVQLPVTGKSADGEWYQVEWEGQTGWVWSRAGVRVEGDLDSVPVVSP